MSNPLEHSDPSHTALDAGLCDSCRHQRLVRNTRGSVFSLCELSRSDPAFARYPRLPVLSCTGYEPRPGDADPAEPKPRTAPDRPEPDPRRGPEHPDPDPPPGKPGTP